MRQVPRGLALALTALELHSFDLERDVGAQRSQGLRSRRQHYGLVAQPPEGQIVGTVK